MCETYAPFEKERAVCRDVGSMGKLRVLLVVALPVTIAVVVLGAQGARASTPACTNGPLAPGGVLSGMCMSDPGTGHVVLRGCNGSNWQRWIRTEVPGTGGHSWINRATHGILSAAPPGAQLVTVSPPSTPPAGPQLWHFSR